jgi:SpoVK/Ycf46/Vps4 family AAA+-type ATPase
MSIDPLDLAGKWYRREKDKIARIITYQRDHMVKKGIKGFLFHGVPGTGKTTLAKSIAFYCADKFGNEKTEEGMKKYYSILDCSDLAHARYGETEAHIHKVFLEAANARQAGINFKVLIFDDADGLFITRDYGSKLEAWYIGQINVFFHELDEMETDKTCVILTTNRLDLMDKAVIDRLFPVEFPRVPADVLAEKVDIMARDLGFTSDEKNLAALKAKVHEAANDATFSFRGVEKIVYEYYIEKIIGVK